MHATSSPPPSAAPLTRLDRIAGGLLGQLVGDACGVPYEFHAAAEIPPLAAIEMTPPEDFRRAHRGVPVGTYSDDGAQALCLLASLLERGTLDPDDFARRLVAWFEDGYCAVDGDVFDCGVQTGQAIRALMGGAAALSAGPASEQANGNGSLMRVLPLALWHTGVDAALVRDAHRQSRVTHGHPRSQVCCALYCLWARRILDEHPEPWASAVESLREIYDGDEKWLGELEFHVRPDDLSPGRGGGYVVDCLRSARWAVDQGGYEDVIRASIALGNDTDTTACVAGGIAGLRDGQGAIPIRWRAALRGGELFEPLLAGLLDRARSLLAG
jgi:ADP-ribosylglycohydrolase